MPVDEAPPSPAREPNPTPSREQRLAAQLRENLRRRKAQAKAIKQGEQATLPKAGPKS